ncbi:MAG: glycosyltransferase family 2 protein, partial [Solirubrobacteraceae bacterium]
SYPVRPLRTPFMCALALIRRPVFEAQSYDVGFGGNAYREETDFFIRAERAGFSCWLTPSTHSWQVHRWPGGQHTARWHYELWTVRNNGRFLRRHSGHLHRRNLGGRPVLVQLRFTGRRARSLLEFYGRPVAAQALRRVGLRR